ncbi:MAG: bifunctional phosphopantothenoylcysteine decarboxylase/phosphopantothenate--cysteine ligase CoaBC [Alphaproteobacteria bacterium]|nr:bifunctional phosphopantothenoylcysteine decarboxylase/phosphopantothenate--cysteine ligase CoaBC [Alphaproteobacteria bacterium]
MLVDKTILLVIGGGIAAFKALELIRRLRELGAKVIPVLTSAGAEFVTPLSVSALAASPVHTDLFDLTNEAEMGHIELSRCADLVVVCPATADFLAKMATGLANDLASTLLLATDKPVLIAPAMNVRMWNHPATVRNVEMLRHDGILFVGPNRGEMACGEFGEGRLAEPAEIVSAIEVSFLGDKLAGKRVLVTSGPTFEPIDPVRYLANRSSGAQGAEIARALVMQGAEVVFVTGPAEVAPPAGVKLVSVETAVQMAAAVRDELPVDVAIFAAAVADWRVKKAATGKIKKTQGGTPPSLDFTENPDILATTSKMKSGRPKLVIGFAAETENVEENAIAKRLRKGCDWILANDVSPKAGIMGGTENAVTLISHEGLERWPRLSKAEVAVRLADQIHKALLS